VYCTRVGLLSDEHVLPTWIAKLVATEGGRFETFTHKEGRLIRHFESVDNLGVVARVVCERCNNGWMERLETSVRRSLVPMIQGRSVDFDQATIRTLARWATKTHQMYRYHLRRPPAARARAAVYRGHVPSSAFVLLAAWHGNSRAYVSHDPHIYRVTKINAPSDPSRDDLGEVEVLTLRINRAIVQAIDVAPPRKDVSVVFDRREFDYVLPVWPPPSGGVGWPPPKFMGDQDYAAFCYRMHRTAPLERPTAFGRNPAIAALKRR
jgi:hypothetical protein